MPGTTDKKEVRLPREPSDLYSWRKWVVAALKALAGAAGVNLSVQGASRVQRLTDNNVHIDLPEAAAATEEIWSNFQPTFVDATHITVSNGSFNLTTPFIGGTAINATTPPQLTVDASALQIVYLVVDTTIQTNADNYVTGFTIKSPTSSNLTIEAFSTAQTSTNTKRYIELFRWQAGALVNRSRYNNIGAQVRDDGTATGVPVWQTW